MHATVDWKQENLQIYFRCWHNCWIKVLKIKKFQIFLHQRLDQCGNKTFFYQRFCKYWKWRTIRLYKSYKSHNSQAKSVISRSRYCSSLSANSAPHRISLSVAEKTFLFLYYFLDNQTECLASVDFALFQIHQAGTITSKSFIYSQFSLSKIFD